MTIWVAFLRGINLGRRQMKMAELKACCEALGFTEVKTLLASGNVRFVAKGDPKARLEQAIAERFGFASAAIMRSAEEIEGMIAGNPFAAVPEAADVKRYVLLFDRALAPGLELVGGPGDFDVAGLGPREAYFVAHKLPNGRYGEGLDKIDKQFEKGAVATMRNWNTILKALA